MRGVEIVLLLVVLATAVAAFAGRLNVPAPSLLVVAGLAVAFIPGVPPVRVAPDIVSVVVLPPVAVRRLAKICPGGSCVRCGGR